MDKSRQKLMILGFDGTSPDLLERWLAEGKLPFLKQLIDQGAYAPMRSVPNMSSPPAWTSMITGKNPGKHGIYRFTERNFNSYRYTYVNGAFRKSETFWDILCGEKTGCIINVPMSYPAQEINGCMISGLDTPGANSEDACYPRDLISKLNSRTSIPYRIAPDFGHMLRNGGRFGDVAEHLLDSMEMRYTHTCLLMEEYDWDIFKVVFSEPDLVHHFFWKFFDPTHPDYRQEDADRYGDTIFRIYERMDDISRRLVEANPDATVMIVSDHGGAVNTRGNELMCDWLESLGLLQRKHSGQGESGFGLASIKRKIASLGFRAANKLLSKETKMRLARKLPSLREGIESAFRLGDIDWENTKAFNDGAQDDIWINLKGRDPLGVVTDAEYDQICEFICSELRQAVDTSTGKPIVEAVFTKKDAYSGNHVDKASDITYVWKTDAVINGIKTPNSPEISKIWEWPAENATGGHSMDGILIAHGPGIVNGTRLEDVQIMDIAPTVLYFFDKEIPQDIDGRVITKMFSPERIEKNPPRIGVPEGESKVAEEIYDDEDSSVIEQRLKDLGYI